MANILIKPNQLRSTAESLIQKAKSIHNAINAVEKDINDLNSIVFAGNRASGLKTHYSKVRNELLSSSSLIQKFSDELKEIAQVFGKADGVPNSNLPLKSISKQPAEEVITKEITPLAIHKLANVNPSNYTSCALYAAARRPDLGSTQSDREEYEDQAAANYISKYKETAFQVNSNTDLTGVIAKGYAVVWQPKVQNANSTYGHVAIVEEVGKDYIVVSHAGWKTGSPTTIPISKLNELWLIP